MIRDIKKEIIQLVIDCAPKAELDKIDDETQLLDDLEYESLSIIDLFEQINQKFDIDCYENPDIYDSLENLSALISFVTKSIMKEGR